MSEDGDLYDDSLPSDKPAEEGNLLRYVIIGVAAILVYAVVVIVMAVGGF